MRFITFRAWDASAAKKDGKPLTLTDIAIMTRSKLTHLELQFGAERHHVSFSSTLADGANGCRFKYIDYSHPHRWKTWTVKVTDEEERRMWNKACEMADMPVEWQVLPVINRNGCYFGDKHTQYDKPGLMSFALKKSGKWWLNLLRGVVWGWTFAFQPDDIKVWCSEACAEVWNAGLVFGKVFIPTIIDPYEAMCKAVMWVFVMVFMVAGCAKVDIVLDKDKKVTEFHSVTVLKDISIDPNGLASTTSSATDGVIGGIVGFLTAWATK